MRLLIASLVLLLPFPAVPWADECTLDRPTGNVQLRIEGQLSRCNAAGEAHFDMAMIEALPSRVVRTETPWEAGAITFEGVLLRDLLHAVGATGSTIRVTALNDYAAEIAIADTQSINVILAYKRNGEYMSVREKGPLFVIFPYEELPEGSKPERHAQSVWQVARITIK